MGSESNPDYPFKGNSEETITVIPRKAHKLRVYQEDEMETFRDNDIITSYEDLNEKYCPLGFQYKKTDDYVIYFHLKFDDYTSFPKVFECIRIDRDLHVQLQFNGNPVPLPPWFIQGTQKI